MSRYHEFELAVAGGSISEVVISRTGSLSESEFS